MPHTLPSISMTSPALNDERGTSPLPPIGHDISRPPSASTASDRRGSHQGSDHGGEKVTLPALSTLANVASQGNPTHQRPAASVQDHGNSLDESRPVPPPQMHSQPASNAQNAAYSNASPTPTSVAGQGNVPVSAQFHKQLTFVKLPQRGHHLCHRQAVSYRITAGPRTNQSRDASLIAEPLYRANPAAEPTETLSYLLIHASLSYRRPSLTSGLHAVGTSYDTDSHGDDQITNPTFVSPSHDRLVNG